MTVMKKRLLMALFASVTSAGAITLVSVPLQADAPDGCENLACQGFTCGHFTGSQCTAYKGGCINDRCSVTR